MLGEIATISIVFAMSVLAIAFAGYLAFKVLREDEGTPLMKEISNAIRSGAKAYLKRQYKVIAIYFGFVFVILFLLAYVFPLSQPFGNKYLSIFVPFAFLTGGFFSALSGYVGMTIATKANVRTTNAAKHSLNKGLRVAFNSGAVMGLAVVGLGLFDLSVWFFVLNGYYSNPAFGFTQAQRIAQITSAMLTFGMGASSVALFARVGGGIYTKAADVGADLVGKVEAGIPEDDPRNPAVIADNVGDNVGDVAGMGADLYESYVGSIIATMALAVAAGLSFKGVTIPLSLAAIGVVSSIAGTFFVKTKESATQSALLRALRKGVFSSAVMVVAISYFAVRFLLGADLMGVYYSVVIGLVAGIIIGLSTEYFTSQKYRPTQKIAESAKTGPATVIIAGMSTGMMSTAIPILTVVAAILGSFIASGGIQNFDMGLYGIGVSAVGLLSTLGITLATDAYGPVADNAGGIAQMSRQKPIVRKRTDAYDSLGNTTAATGKGFAIGSAALTALALIAAYREEVAIVSTRLMGRALELNLSLMNPKIVAGLFIGGMLPFVFCSLTMSAVGRAAQMIVIEVRRQFKEIKGLMEGKAKPDHAKCVMISTKAAQREMIVPSLLAIVSPIIVGILLGVEAVMGLLVGGLVSGFMLAIYMANAGGAWDNAKKFIEEGHLGGKGSDAHKASVVGDTVGDPLKDTSGPSLNILIKLMSMVSLVFASFVVMNAVF